MPSNISIKTLSQNAQFQQFDRGPEQRNAVKICILNVLFGDKCFDYLDMERP